MKRMQWVFCVAMLTLLASAAAPAADDKFAHKTIPGASPEPIVEGAGLKSREDLEAFFDGVMAAHMAAQRIAGATVAVVKDGQLFFAKGYGYADLDKRIPVDPDRTLFRPGSTSKLFTWTAVMQLVEQGKLDLDKDVNTYVTQFQIPATFPEPITLRNLMTHTPGLEDGGIGYLLAKEAGKTPPLEEALKEHMPTRVRPPTTDFTDGLNSSYSNWGTALAGLIVADVSGMPFDDYIEQNIFKPLGMTSSSFHEPLPPELAPRMSTGYKYDKGAHKAGPFEAIHHFGPAGSLTSSATDMAKFMIAHLQNGRYGDARILKEETAKLMHARQFSPSPYVDGTGLGFYETWINGRRWINHAGDTVYFHSNLSLLEEQNLGVFVSYNTGPILPFSSRDDLLHAFTDRYFPAKLPVIKPPEDFKQRAARYAGSYQVIRHSFTKNEALFGLFGATLSVAPTADNTLLMAALGGAPPSQWAEVAPNTFRRLDRQDMVTFIEDGNGGMKGMVWPFPFHATHKLKWYEGLQWNGFVALLALLSFIVAVVGALRHWKADRAADAVGRNARRMAALNGLVNLAFLVLLVVTFAGDLDDLIYAWPPMFKVALAFPLLAIPLTLATLYFAFRLWAGKLWTAYGRIQYSVVAVASLLFLVALNHFNLVGYHFG